MRSLSAPKHLSGLSQKVGPSLALTPSHRGLREACAVRGARAVFGDSPTPQPLEAGTFPRQPCLLVAPATFRLSSALGVVERKSLSAQLGVASRLWLGYIASGHAMGQASAA